MCCARTATSLLVEAEATAAKSATRACTRSTSRCRTRVAATLVLHARGLPRGTAYPSGPAPRSSPVRRGRRSPSRTRSCASATSRRSATATTASCAIAEASRCLQCKKPACVDGCPVEVDIPGFVQLVAAGDFAAAARVIREKNALPAICGRVCPQDDQCEKLCVLGKKGEPIAIGALERFAADFERETDQVDAAAACAEDEPPRRRRRQRPGRPHHGLRHGRQGPQRHHLRGAAQPGRRARLRHPGVPPAQGDRRGRDRQPAAPRASSSSSTASSASCTVSRSCSIWASTRCTWPPEPVCPASWGCPERTSATSSRRTSTSRA